MKSYCLKCRKDTESINPKVSNTSNGRKTKLSKCAICGSKKSRFIKDQEAKGLLSNLGVRTPLSKVPILDDILFWTHAKLYIRMSYIRIVNKFLLAGDKTFNIAKNPKYDGYQRGLASMIYKFFDEKAKGGGVKYTIRV